MMKNLVLGLVLTAFIFMPIEAQNKKLNFLPPEPASENSVDDIMRDHQFHINKIVVRAVPDGSPYVFAEFATGVIYSTKEKLAYSLELNINAISNLIEFKYQEDTFEMPNFAFDSVFIYDSEFVPVSIVEDDVVKISPMEVLDSDGKGNYLLKKHIVKYVDATEVKPFIEATPAHYKKYPPLYFVYSVGNGLIGLENLKNIEKMDGMPKDLKSFVKKHKIKRRNENDLRLLFNYIYQ